MRAVFWLESVKGRDHLEDLGVDGKIILEWIFGKESGGVIDWMHVTQVPL
jgi:hypothetical protein